MTLHSRIAAVVIPVLLLAGLYFYGRSERRGDAQTELPTTNAGRPATRLRTFETITQPLVIMQTDLARSQKDWSQNEWVRILWHLQSPYGPEINDGMQWAIKKWFGDNGKSTPAVTLGALKLSSSAIGIPKSAPASGYSLWQVSIPMIIEPTWDRIADFPDDFSHVGIQFRLVDESGKATAQLVDVLPNTRFDPANYGGKASFQMHIGADRRWEMVEGSAKAEAAFWWNWNPKVLVTASGASGNEAFCLLNKKPDKTGWVGSVPIELLIMAPDSVGRYALDVEPFLMFKSEVPIKLAKVQMSIELTR